MNYATIYKTVEIIWLIDGLENYGFGKDKLLYNIKRGTTVKQTSKNGMIGYWFGKRFISLKALRPLIYKPLKQKIYF